MEPQEIELAEFPLARRGYDPDQVRSFLANVASEYRQALSAAAAADSKSKATPGEEISHRVASIVDSAEQAAADILSSARFEAEQLRTAAREEAASTNNAALRHLQEAVRIREQAEKHAEEIQAAGRAEAERIESEAQQMASLLLADARDHAASIEREARLRAVALERSASANAASVLAEARTRYERLQAAERESLARLATVESLVREARESVEAGQRNEVFEGLGEGEVRDVGTSDSSLADLRDEDTGTL
ncbi:MAG: DivIVA domain-containing protein [Actinomycetota bacterium]|nr:DivIVA domain-containing protein [Actinomycetota bacterium]